MSEENKQLHEQVQELKAQVSAARAEKAALEEQMAPCREWHHRTTWFSAKGTTRRKMAAQLGKILQLFWYRVSLSISVMLTMFAVSWACSRA